MAKKLLDVPESLNEEFYQINADILTSFPKYRPPLNIFVFREDVSRIVPYFRVGERLSNEQVAELHKLTHEGFIFVSREDHPIYVKHIAHQLDLVLVDKNLKEKEIADVFLEALTMRLEEFMEQPVRPVFDRLREDILVLTQYLWEDIYRIRSLMRRLHREHTLGKHSVNCGIVGLALFIRINGEALREGNLKRKVLDNTAIALFIHDLGMTKVPKFIREKTKPLTMDERTKLNSHSLSGNEMLNRLDIKFNELERCVMEHHERLDSSGYPQKKKSTEMSPIGRLCALVDSYCAMITKRPYAEAMEPADAIKELASDVKRYDARLSKVLQAIVLTG